MLRPRFSRDMLLLWLLAGTVALNALFPHYHRMALGPAEMEICTAAGMRMVSAPALTAVYPEAPWRNCSIAPIAVPAPTASAFRPITPFHFQRYRLRQRRFPLPVPRHTWPGPRLITLALRRTFPFPEVVSIPVRDETANFPRTAGMHGSG